MNNVMLDLETLGQTAGCPILSIGAVFFDESGIGAKFHRHIDLNASLRKGFKVDSDTLLWWIDQSSDARKGVINGQKDCYPIKQVLTEFAEFLEAGDVVSSNVKVWGNGASFDNALLASYYKEMNMQLPWKFWNDKCYRTVKSMYPKIEMVRSGTHHNALDDAISQAKHLQDIWEFSK